MTTRNADGYEIKFVWVDLNGALREFDPKTGEGPILEPKCRDRVLIDASESVENGAAQGVVRAYLGVDKHWHFDGLISRAERRTLDLWANADERDSWKVR